MTSRSQQYATCLAHVQAMPLSEQLAFIAEVSDNDSWADCDAVYTHEFDAAIAALRERAENGEYD